MRSPQSPKLSSLQPILCASILALLSACSSGKGVNHKTAPEVKTDAQTSAQADAAAKEQARIARYDQEIKDLTQKLKTATEANAELEDDFNQGVRVKVMPFENILGPEKTEWDYTDLDLIGFNVDTEAKPTSVITVRETNRERDPEVLTLIGVGLVEEGMRSVLEYCFRAIGDAPLSKLLMAFRDDSTKLTGKKIEFTLPEKIQLNQIDTKNKKRTSIWAGAVTGDILFHTEASDGPSYATVTTKITQAGEDSGAALSVIEEQTKQAPSRSVVELIEKTQISNNSQLGLSDSSAIIVLKLNGYKIIGSYNVSAEADLVEDEKAYLKREISNLEKRTDKFEVVEAIEIIKTKESEG